MPEKRRSWTGPARACRFTIAKRVKRCRLRSLSPCSAPARIPLEELLERLSHRPLRKRKGTRASLFESPALQPLPTERYLLAQMENSAGQHRLSREIDRHYYSVPCQLAGQQLEARYTATTIELFHGGKRVASHARSSAAYRHATISEHTPKSHRAHLEWTPSRFTHWVKP